MQYNKFFATFATKLQIGVNLDVYFNDWVFYSESQLCFMDAFHVSEIYLNNCIAQRFDKA